MYLLIGAIIVLILVVVYFMNSSTSTVVLTPTHSHGHKSGGGGGGSGGHHTSGGVGNGFTITTVVTQDPIVAAIQNDVTTLTILAAAIQSIQLMWTEATAATAAQRALTLPSMVTYNGVVYAPDGPAGASAGAGTSTTNAIYNSTMNSSVGVALLTIAGPDKLPFMDKARNEAVAFTALLGAIAGSAVATFVAVMNDRTNNQTFNKIVSAKTQADLNSPDIMAMLGAGGTLCTSFTAAMNANFNGKPIIMGLATYASQFAHDVVASWGTFDISAKGLPTPTFKTAIQVAHVSADLPFTAFLSSYLASIGQGAGFGLLLSAMQLSVEKACANLSKVHS